MIYILQNIIDQCIWKDSNSKNLLIYVIQIIYHTSIQLHISISSDILTSLKLKNNKIDLNKLEIPLKTLLMMDEIILNSLLLIKEDFTDFTLFDEIDELINSVEQCVTFKNDKHQESLEQEIEKTKNFLLLDAKAGDIEV